MSISKIKKFFHTLSGEEKKGSAWDSTKTNKTINENGKRKSSRTRYGNLTLQQATQRHIDQAQYSTAKNYRMALRSMKAYNGGRDVLLCSITPQFVAGYEKWLKAKGVCKNTISCYMRSARALYRKAGKIPNQPKTDPFAAVFTGNAKTRKRSITEEELSRLMALELSGQPSLQFARDLFLFSFYAMGMPFVDMCSLEKVHIEGDSIYYERRKTGQAITVRIEPCMRDIINRYDDPDSTWVFPIFKSNTSKDFHQQYASKLTHYNIMLRKLGEKAGIRKSLSSYVSRHTWASIAHESNVDLNIISRAMGHTNSMTTLIYIAEIRDEKLAEANKKILNHLQMMQEI